MKMIVVDAIPQADGLTRYLLDSDSRAARANMAHIREVGDAEAATPAYIVDVDRATGRLRAERYPGSDMSVQEWEAARAAILTPATVAHMV
jgi:hypothetical protein